MLKDLPVSTLVALSDGGTAAMETWNHRDQAVAAVEEFQELGVHLCRYANGKDRPDWEHGVREEVADALICLEQMAQLFFRDAAHFNEYVLMKLAKQAGKIERTRAAGIGKERQP